jgi:uncharacterized protein YciU (UPF0263 family)
VQTLSQRLHIDRKIVPIARVVLTVLSTDVLTSSLQVELALEVLEPEDLSTFLVQLAERGGLHADALQTAIRQLEDSVQYSDPEDLQAIEARLAGADHEHVRRLGLAALVAATREQGWTQERVERLNAYRADGSMLVASSAQFTFPVAEVD